MVAAGCGGGLHRPTLRSRGRGALRRARRRVVFFPRGGRWIAPGATAEVLGGAEVPLTDAEIDAVLRAATRRPDGTYRAALSRMAEGEPLGPWGDEGTRADDPNDVVPHESRGDRRGIYVLFSWIGQIDARPESPLSAWMRGDDERGYVPHDLIAFGGWFGELYDGDALALDFAHDQCLNLTASLVDYLTLGLVDPPWYHARIGPAGRKLGYCDTRRFEPDAWAPGYPDIGFDAYTEHDAAWMSRVLARILIERRRRILERYRVVTLERLEHEDAR